MTTEMQGKVALVTGSARGVGREIVRHLAKAGAKVAINYRSAAAEADALVKEIRAAKGDAIAVAGDVSKFSDATTMVEAVVSQWGRIDVLVNNAGLVIPRKFMETTEQDWQSQIGVGLFGVIHTCRAALPHMAKQGSGRVISLCGDSARVGEASLSVTAASRGGVISLTKSLAKEMGRHNITANVVSLGLINTDHTDPVWLETNKEKILRNYAIRRIGEPTDVAPLVAFLASDQAGWITGQVMSVNGGFSMV